MLDSRCRGPRVCGILPAEAAEVLCHFAAERYRQRLYAAADTKDRKLTVESQPDSEELGEVAGSIDGVEEG